MIVRRTSCARKTINRLRLLCACWLRLPFVCILYKLVIPSICVHTIYVSKNYKNKNNSTKIEKRVRMRLLKKVQIQEDEVKVYIHHQDHTR